MFQSENYNIMTLRVDLEGLQLHCMLLFLKLLSTPAGLWFKLKQLKDHQLPLWQTYKVLRQWCFFTRLWQLHFKSIFSPLFNYMQQYQIHGSSAKYICTRTVR